jgi:hypothetical protein
VNALRAAHLRCMTQLADRVRTIPARRNPDGKAWNPEVRKGSVPYQVLEELKRHGTRTNEELQAALPVERKFIIVALYALRKKKLIEGLGEQPYSMHRMRGRA